MKIMTTEHTTQMRKSLQDIDFYSNQTMITEA